MAQIKNYGLIGVGSQIQFGKQGGYINFNSSTSKFGFYDSTSTNLLQIQALDPVLDSDVATKNYVDATSQGLSVKDSVACASTSNLTVGSAQPTPLTIDGYTVLNNDRVLVKDQTDTTQNGIYVADVTTTTYTLERATDTLQGGSFVFVVNGNTNADTGFIISSPSGSITIGTDEITWTQFSSASSIVAGSGLSKSSSTLSVNTDGVTIGVISNDLSVLSSSTAGQVLISDGTATDSATWGALNLASTNAVTGILPVLHGGTGLSTVGASGTFLSSNGTSTAFDYVTTLYDSSGNKVVQTYAATNPVNLLQISNAGTGNSPSIAAVGSDTNIDITFTPVGTGEVLVPSTYTANIASTNALVTKSYVDTAVTEATASATTPMLIISELTATSDPAFAESVSIGTIPNSSGKTCYITDITVNVKTVLKTATYMTITVGANTFVDVSSTDGTVSGVYKIDGDYSYDASGMTVKANFFSDAGTTAATPTAGDIIIAVNYKFAS